MTIKLITNNILTITNRLTSTVYRPIFTIFIFLGAFIIIGFASSYRAPIHAQDYDFCDFFPCAASPDGGANEGKTLGLVERIFNLGVSAIFVGFIIAGLGFIIKGALKITRSEGDEAKIQEGAQVIKGVFIGIAMLIVGLIGLIIVLAIFNAGGIANVNIQDPDGVDIPIVNN